jgi:hypothetical protein
MDATAALIAEAVKPLLARIEALEADLKTLRALSERAEVTDSFPPAVSTGAGRYDGQVRFLTDLGVPVYWYAGAWRRFSDDAAV